MDAARDRTDISGEQWHEERPAPDWAAEMGDILGQVERWRMKAHELRAASDGLSNAAARDALLEMAEGYDRLADDMEHLEIKQRARKASRS